MSNLITAYFTTPGTHAAASGHWDMVKVAIPDQVGQEEHAPILGIRFQNGPVREHGVNGVQIVDVLQILRDRVDMLNRSFPCPENDQVLVHLDEAIRMDGIRTSERAAQGVEGFDKKHVS